uniref:Si:ch211-215a10.4 n=1 Tax=Takifugu rubripes TaxID=31033 RepID=A0A674PCU3_TAKRU
MSSRKVSSRRLSSRRLSSRKVSSRKVSSRRVSSRKVSSRRVSSRKVSSRRLSSRRVSSRKVSSRRLSSRRVSSRRLSSRRLSSRRLSSRKVSSRRLSSRRVSSRRLSSRKVSSRKVSSRRVSSSPDCSWPSSCLSVSYLAAQCCSPSKERWSQPTGQGSELPLEVDSAHLLLELPRFFQKNHDYSMYSADLEFINGPLNMKTRGRVRYQLFLSLWRLLSLCYYAEVRLEVLKLTKHMEDGTIKARWRVKGLPFHSVLLRFYYKDKSQLYRTSDAFSTFYLGEDGLIHCHRVEKMMPSQPPILSRVTSLLAKTLVALGLQEQRPALNLLPLLLTSLRQARTPQQD